MENEISSPSYRNKRDIFIAVTKLSGELSENLKRYGTSEAGSDALEKFRSIYPRLEKAFELFFRNETKANEYVNALRSDRLIGEYMK